MKRQITAIMLMVAICAAPAATASSGGPGVAPVASVTKGSSMKAYEGRPGGKAYNELRSRTRRSQKGMSNPFLAMPLPGAAVRLPKDDNGQLRVPMLAPDNLPDVNLKGWIAYNEIDIPIGIYNLPLEPDGQIVMQYAVDTSDIVGLNGGAAGGGYYVYTTQGLYIEGGLEMYHTSIMDLRTGQVLATIGDYGDYGRLAMDMTYDPTTSRFYGCFMDDAGEQWMLGYMEVDPLVPDNTVRTVHHVYPLETALNGIAADNRGNLWAIRNDNGALVKVDRRSGNLTAVGRPASNPGYVATLTWDEKTDCLYWAVVEDLPGGKLQTSLYSIDTETGTRTLLTDFGGRVFQPFALYADYLPEDTAPSPVSEMALNFDGPSLQGEVTFDAPATMASGNEGEGELTVSLDVTDATTFATVLNEQLTAQYGEKGLTFDVQVPQAALYTFTLTVVDAQGQASMPVSVQRFIGADTPTPITGLGVTYGDGDVRVSWNPVSAGGSGGYFNPDEWTYHVVLSRQTPDGVTSTVFDDIVSDSEVTVSVGQTDDLVGFRAEVSPVRNGVQTAGAATSWQWFGAVTPPYTHPMTYGGAWTTTTLAGGNWTVSAQAGFIIPYNWGAPNDSWIFSPPIAMQGGELYVISFDASSDIVDHTGSINLGTTATPAGMTIELMSFTCMSNSSVHWEIVTRCPETAVYYVGVHNNTNSNTWTNRPNMYLRNFSIVPVDHASPAKPEMTCVPDENGEPNVEITIHVPGVDLDGNALEGNVEITLKRGSSVIFSREDAQPGETLSFTDSAIPEGLSTYSCTAGNTAGEGEPAIVPVYVGIPIPKDPAKVNVEPGATASHLKASWSPVTVSAFDTPLKPEQVSYNLINILSSSYVQRGITETTHEFEAAAEGMQDAYYLSVNAETAGGVSSTYGTYSEEGIIFAGTPQELPYRNTFSENTTLPMIVVNQTSGYDQFGIVDVMTDAGVSDVNGDNMAMAAFVPYANSSAGLYTGTIHISADAVAPALSFWILNDSFGTGNPNQNKLTVAIIGDRTGAALVDEVTYSSLPAGWSLRTIDLGLLKDDNVHLLFTFYTNSFTTHYIDDLRFFDRKQSDLEMIGITVPEQANAGAQFSVYAEVANNGLTAISASTDATVELLRDGRVIDSKRVGTLRSLATKKISFTDRLSQANHPSATYAVRVVWADDEDSANNEHTAVVTIPTTIIPEPEEFEVVRGEGGYPSLTWLAPDMEPEYRRTTAWFEGFEGYSAVHLDGFTSLDVDGNVNYYGALGMPIGWQLYYHPGLSHSGNSFLASCATVDGGAKEDWLISPRLSGRAQTVEFYVRTSWGAHENYEVLLSSGGDSAADFDPVPVLNGRTLSDDWTFVSVDVPEGTRHFAIVARATDTSNLMFLMVDDVTYEPASPVEQLVHTGYQVYRNRQPLEMTVGADKIGFVDTGAGVGGYYYRLTALYEGQLESNPTTECYIFSRGGAPESGIETVVNDNVTVTVEPGMITISTRAGVNAIVSDAMGRLYLNDRLSDVRREVPVTSGVYVITLDGESLKVVVP